MARKNRQKPEEKPVDFLDQFGTTTIIEEPKIEEPKIEEEQATIEESGPRGPREVNRVTGEEFKYKVKVISPSLRMRYAPNTQAEVYGLITDQGIYTITDEVNGWGQLENGYWIMLSYTKIV